MCGGERERVGWHSRRAALALPVVEGCGMRWSCTHRTQARMRASWKKKRKKTKNQKARKPRRYFGNAQFRLRGQRQSNHVLTIYCRLREISARIGLQTSVLFWLQTRCWGEYCPQLLVIPAGIYCLHITGSELLVNPSLTHCFNQPTLIKLIKMGGCPQSRPGSLFGTPDITENKRPTLMMVLRLLDIGLSSLLTL